MDATARCSSFSFYVIEFGHHAALPLFLILAIGWHLLVLRWNYLPRITVGQSYYMK